MTRPQIPYRRVEALAKECSEMRAWLRGLGAAAPESEFQIRLRAYKALCEAVAFLPHGAALLKKFGGRVVGKGAMQPTTQRSADSFTADELALFKKDEAVLTPDGWVVAAPLVQHVDRVIGELRESGHESSDQHALEKIRERAARSSGKRSASLGSLKTRVSRERKQAITERSKKVPPTDKGM